jgi:hypothetical protein
MNVMGVHQWMAFGKVRNVGGEKGKKRRTCRAESLFAELGGKAQFI